MNLCNSASLKYGDAFDLIAHHFGGPAADEICKLRRKLSNVHTLACTGYAYLAGPYTSPCEDTQAERAGALSAAAALLMPAIPIYSPISHGCTVASYLPIQRDHAWWMRQCLPLVAGSSAVLVLELPGWKSSEGLAQEVELAHRRGLPVINLPMRVALPANQPPFDGDPKTEPFATTPTPPSAAQLAA